MTDSSSTSLIDNDDSISNATLCGYTFTDNDDYVSSSDYEPPYVPWESYGFLIEECSVETLAGSDTIYGVKRTPDGKGIALTIGDLDTGDDDDIVIA